MLQTSGSHGLDSEHTVYGQKGPHLWKLPLHNVWVIFLHILQFIAPPFSLANCTKLNLDPTEQELGLSKVAHDFF